MDENRRWRNFQGVTWTVDGDVITGPAPPRDPGKDTLANAVLFIPYKVFFYIYSYNIPNKSTLNPFFIYDSESMAYSLMTS